MIQRKGVEGVKRVAWLVAIDAIGAAWTCDVEVKVLLLNACRGIERPDADTRCDSEIGTERIDRFVEVNVFDKSSIRLRSADVCPLGDGVLGVLVGGSESEPSIGQVQRQLVQTFVEQLRVASL